MGFVTAAQPRRAAPVSWLRQLTILKNHSKIHHFSIILAKYYATINGTDGKGNRHGIDRPKIQKNYRAFLREQCQGIYRISNSPRDFVKLDNWRVFVFPRAPFPVAAGRPTQIEHVFGLQSNS
jgi:hypothetical protein